MSAADLMARIDAARGDRQKASDMLAEARGMGRREEPQPTQPQGGGLLEALGGISGIGHTILDVAGFIPVVGAVADLANAGWYAAEGDYVNAGLSAVGAIPFAGDAAAAVRLGARGVNAATDIARNADNVTDAARATDTAAEITRITPPSGGPVIFNAPPGSTPEQIEQVRQYVDGCNDALAAGALSPTGRVSTQGALRSQASTAAAERRRAVAAGQTYQGVAGHVPDTTWTGNPQPHTWMDMDARVNSSLGAQSQRYPEGYQPTGFEYGGVADG
jgi:hypothetical protein